MTDFHQPQWSRRRFMGGAVGLASLGSLAAACNGTGETSAAAGTVPSSGAAAALPSASASANASSTAGGVDADLLMQRYGLKPFAPAPANPAVKPITLDPQDPTIFSKVPTTDRKSVV